VPAAAPRDPRPAVAGPDADATPYRAGPGWPRATGGRSGHHQPRARVRAIEATAVEEPRSWSAPATRARLADHRPLAHRVGASGPDVLPAPVPSPSPDLAVLRGREARPGGPPHPRESGERHRFVALARQRLAGGGIPFGLVTPPPSRSPAPDRPPAPRPGYPGVAADDLVACFARAVEEAGGVCHQVVGQVPDLLLDHLVAELDAWDVVVADHPDARDVGERLADRGVEVAPAGRDAAGRAVLGVTSAVAGIAATGAVVLDRAAGGGPLPASLPPAHLCLLPVERLVAAPADVLRALGTGPGGAVPASLCLVTGPARRGDIEGLLTAGVPGPGALHVVVVSPPPEGAGSR
jgi:L-lactate dehydrogenase complex protein LldG